MSNMSYCRWHNTRMDLRDCINAFNCQEEISELEKSAGKQMCIEFLDFMVQEGVIEEYDEGRIIEMFDEYEEAEEDEDGWEDY